MLFVAMPAYPGTNVILGAQCVLDALGPQRSEAFNARSKRQKPPRQTFGRFKLLVREVVFSAKVHDPALAFVVAELERRQGQGSEPDDEVALFVRANEIWLIAQPRRT